MATRTYRYRWATPQEWLLEKADGWTHERLLIEFKRLVVTMDADEVQDNFQNEMDDDGYFKKLRREGPTMPQGPQGKA